MQSGPGSPPPPPPPPPPGYAQGSSSSTQHEQQHEPESSTNNGSSSIKADKSCHACRLRKIRCSRDYPTCTRCRERNLQCSFGELVPSSYVVDHKEDERIAKLEARLAELEHLLWQQRQQPSMLPPPGARGVTGVASGEGGAREGLPVTLSGPASLGLVLPPAPPLERFSLRRAMLLNDVYEIVSSGAVHSDVFRAFLQRQYMQLSGSSFAAIDLDLAMPHLALALVRHLINEFMLSCCGHLPAFEAHHAVASLTDLENLSDSMRCVVAVCCAMGARATSHSAVLGIEFTAPPYASLAEWERNAEAGERREATCGKLESYAVELCKATKIGESISVDNLQVLLSTAQMLALAETVPQASRYMIRLAVGQYVDLAYSSLPPNTPAYKRRLLPPLITLDAFIAAYARKPCEFSDLYLASATAEVGLTLPDVLHDTLENDLFESAYQRKRLDHHSIRAMSERMALWLAAVQREYARIATVVPLANIPQAIRLLFTSGVDQLHECARRVQRLLVDLDHQPAGCDALSGCPHRHFRYVTRLDYEAVNMACLAFAFVRDVFDGQIESDPEAALLYSEVNVRVRHALKLQIFYMTMYASGNDAHMAYHICCQLEQLPDWVELCLQRYGEANGPPSSNDEVSEPELDRLYRALVTASYYCRSANGRLRDMMAKRRLVATSPDLG